MLAWNRCFRERPRQGVEKDELRDKGRVLQCKSQRNKAAHGMCHDDCLSEVLFRKYPGEVSGVDVDCDDGEVLVSERPKPLRSSRWDLCEIFSSAAAMRGVNHSLEAPKLWTKKIGSEPDPTSTTFSSLSPIWVRVSPPHVASRSNTGKAETLD